MEFETYVKLTANFSGEPFTDEQLARLREQYDGNTGHFQAQCLDDSERAYHAAPVVFFLLAGIRDEALCQAVFGHMVAMPWADQAWAKKTGNGDPVRERKGEIRLRQPLMAGTTKTAFWFNEDLILAIQADCDEGEAYIAQSKQILSETTVSFLHSRSSSQALRRKEDVFELGATPPTPLAPAHGVLDGRKSGNVTGDDDFLRLVSTIRFKKIANDRISQFLDESGRLGYLDREDLMQEAIIACCRAWPKFRAAPYLTHKEQWIWRNGYWKKVAVFGETSVHTFFYRVIENRLNDLADSIRRRSVPLLDGDGADHGVTEERLADSRVMRLLAEIPHGDLVLMQAMGYSDNELGLTATDRKRRERARKTLERRLADV